MGLSYHTLEKLNALSHGLGAVLAVFGCFLLAAKVNRDADFALISVIVYGCSLVLLFSASAMYHSARKKKLKENFRILDHISIYFLIAGTYTPVALITLIDGNGQTIVMVVWGIALIGSLLKLFYTGKFEILSLLLYVFMGWLIVFDIRNLLENTTTRGILLLALGGAFYTIGVFFYALKRIPYNHLIWHFFVLGGAISHWCFIYWDIL
ncbi:MAG TPA: hemolysin III family protein [Eudoraea sp.]|nr:hemolysin III family protein [Eudoraea sp.]